MESNEPLFDRVMLKLHTAGILTDLILIGSWVLPIYRVYFDDTPEIPLLRTTDLDLLIQNPPKLNVSVDIPELLKELEFEQVFSVIGGYNKFIHPDLEIEFIIPELGKGIEKTFWVKELKITAQPLRYLYLLQDFRLLVQYKNVTLCVPEPAAFTLMKFLITIKRKDHRKIEKDISTAKQLSHFLLTIPEQKTMLNIVYQKMPNSWYKKLHPILEKHCPELLNFLLE